MTKTHKKTMIIHILDILRKHTDAEPGHQLLQKDIIHILKKEYDMEVDRKAVKRNIVNLIECGFDIEYNNGWYYNHEFEDNELRLLIDSLLFSKTIPVSHKKDLIRKIEGLSNKYFKSKVKHIKTLPISFPANKQLFHTIDILDEAMGKKRQVSFAYCRYKADKKLHPALDDSGKIRRYVVNPYQIVAANGKYYLICNYANHEDVVQCRLDRIMDINLLENKCRDIKEFKGYENGLDLPTHMNEHIYMFSGESIRVKFKAQKFLIGEIIDWFGDGVIFDDENEDEVTVSVKVNETAMICWAMQYGPFVEVMEPTKLREELLENAKGVYKKYGGNYV